MLFICPTNYLASENTTNVESIQIESSLFVGVLKILILKFTMKITLV